MLDDKTIALHPPRRVLLRCKLVATITHLVSSPEPWELLGQADLDGGKPVPQLWTRGGKFSPNPGRHAGDIVGIEAPDAPGSFVVYSAAALKGGQL